MEKGNHIFLANKQFPTENVGNRILFQNTTCVFHSQTSFIHQNSPEIQTYISKKLVNAVFETVQLPDSVDFEL